MRGIAIAACQAGMMLMMASGAEAADLAIAPPTPVVSRDAPASTTVPFAQGFQLGSFRGGFEDTKLEAVRKFVASGVIDRQGDAGDAEAWLCYDLPGGQRVWLSSGEISGGAVDRITLWPAGTARSSHCPAVPAGFAGVAVDGIGLGTTEIELIKRLGQPGKRANGWLVFHHAAKKGQMDDDQTLVVKIDSGRVSALEVSRVVSN